MKGMIAPPLEITSVSTKTISHDYEDYFAKEQVLGAWKLLINSLKKMDAEPPPSRL